MNIKIGDTLRLKSEVDNKQLSLIITDNKEIMKILRTSDLTVVELDTEGLLDIKIEAIIAGAHIYYWVPHTWLE